MSATMDVLNGGSALAGLGQLGAGLGSALAPPVVSGDAQVADDAEAGGEPSQPNMDLADKLKGFIESINVAEDIDEGLRGEIAARVMREFDMDQMSRGEWLDKYEKWLDFAMQIAEQKTYPWPQASNVIYPLITSAALQFHARAYPAIIRDKDVVKGSINGSDKGVPQLDPQTGQPAMDPQGNPVWQTPPGAKADVAQKIGEHMSWQLLEEQEEWEPQTDQLLVILPIVGCMFRKNYFDPGMQRNMSQTVTAKNIVVDYKAVSFETAPRVSEIIELYPYQIEEAIRAGVFLEEDYGTDQDVQMDEDGKTTFIEQHRRWDMDGDGYEEPWIITVARDSGKLARIRAGFDMDGVMFSSKDHRIRKIEPVKYYTKYGFIPSPDGGVYDIGFGHLLFPLNEAINTTLNQMFDAGHLANAGGGFIGSGLSMNAGAIRFQVGEYKPVNTNGGTIRDNVFPIPFPGPNAVLFQLLEFLVAAAKEVAAIKDVMVGDLPGDNTSGIATLAMIEQGLAVFSAIYKRIYRSLKADFKKLFRLNRIYLPKLSGYTRGNQWKDITQQDYALGAGVEPVSDPRMVTDMQALGQAQFLLQFKDDPHFDPIEIRTRMLLAAQIVDPSKLVLDKPQPNPEAAVAEGRARSAARRAHNPFGERRGRARYLPPQAGERRRAAAGAGHQGARRSTEGRPRGQPGLVWRPHQGAAAPTGHNECRLRCRGARLQPRRRSHPRS
jgi:chaperonin GroES